MSEKKVNTKVNRSSDPGVNKHKNTHVEAVAPKKEKSKKQVKKLIDEEVDDMEDVYDLLKLKMVNEHVNTYHKLAVAYSNTFQSYLLIVPHAQEASTDVVSIFAGDNIEIFNISELSNNKLSVVHHSKGKDYKQEWALNRSFSADLDSLEHVALRLAKLGNNWQYSLINYDLINKGDTQMPFKIGWGQRAYITVNCHPDLRALLISYVCEHLSLLPPPVSNYNDRKDGTRQ